MSIVPRDFVAFAENLGTGTEAHVRSAISRAYYGVFHSAKLYHDALPTPGNLTPRPGGIHEELVQRLTNPGVPNTDPRHMKSRQIGAMTRQLRELRVKADYRIDCDMGLAEVANALAQAHKVLEIIEA